MGERRRALKLVRSVGANTLLMWDRGLHSFGMVQASLAQGGDYLGRVPANVKFEVEQELPDGSDLSWIYPDRKSKQKGATQIKVRVIEYSIEMPGQLEPSTYRLITSLLNYEQFPALLLAQEYHQRWQVENTIDEVKTHLLGRQVPIRSLNPRAVVQAALWSSAGTLGSPLLNGASSSNRRNFTFALKLYRYIARSASCCCQVSNGTT